MLHVTQENIKSPIVVEHIPCNCNASDCRECVARVAEGMRQSFHSTLSPANAVLMDAVIDGKGYQDLNAPMSRADFMAAMQQFHGMVLQRTDIDRLVQEHEQALQTIADQQAHIKLIENTHAQLAADHADATHDLALAQKLIDATNDAHGLADNDHK